MLTQPTIEKLCAMRLRGMAEAFQQQQQDANIHALSFEESGAARSQIGSAALRFFTTR